MRSRQSFQRKQNRILLKICSKKEPSAFYNNEIVTFTYLFNIFTLAEISISQNVKWTSY